MQEYWRAPIMLYLREHFDPEDKSKDLRLKYRSHVYMIIDNNLYRKGITQPLLKCITQHEGQEFLLEVHKGLCG
jgi:hypothetical protein